MCVCVLFVCVYHLCWNNFQPWIWYSALGRYLSRWFPKMLVTDPVDPDMVCRDPQAIDRMSRDALIWRQGRLVAPRSR